MPLPAAVRNRFQRINGVSFDELNAAPELLLAVFGGKKNGASSSRTKIFRGRGYPFIGKKRVSAEESERKILDILDNDWRRL